MAAPENSPDGGLHRPVRVVVVTGSSGFLGKHVIRSLQEGEHATLEEIRLFDSLPYEKKLDYHPIKPKRMQAILGSVCDADALRRALHGADAVIHCASIVDTGLFANATVMERVNVHGTKNVVESCVAENVPYIVYSGSVTAMQSKTSAAAAGVELPTGSLCSFYGESKARAEMIVQESNERPLTNGLGRLRTLVIRLLPLYGELDEVFITKALRISKMTYNTVFRLDRDIQGTYAGNAAAVLVRGLDALSDYTCRVSGLCLVATDDTPRDAVEPLLRAVVERRALRMFPHAVPTLALVVLSCIYWGIVLLLSPLFKLPVAAIPTPVELLYVRRCPVHDGSEAARRLAWKPKYGAKQAIATCLEYYTDVKL
ncbi:3 beta-hydroxysteroid dehydrogenase type 7-like isoform X2 [Haemaphysalis longicornis]